MPIEDNDVDRIANLAVGAQTIAFSTVYRFANTCEEINKMLLVNFAPITRFVIDRKIATWERDILVRSRMLYAENPRCPRSVIFLLKFVIHFWLGGVSPFTFLRSESSVFWKKFSKTAFGSERRIYEDDFSSMDPP